LPTDGKDRQPPARAVLSLRGVSKVFGGVIALDDVTLTVAPGELVGLIGPNGAGKTTLFDIASGLQAPTSGVVEIDGRDVTRAPAEQRARLGVRRTFQQAQLFGDLTVEDNILTALDGHGGGGGLLADVVAAPGRRRRERDRRQRVAAVVDELGLGALRAAPAATLPIGQARLVELARAVVDEPRVLLLDEPTSGLTPPERDRLAAVVTAARAGDAAVVLVEHDVSFVMQCCERVVVLDLGRVLADGPPDQVRENPAVRQAYLG
jgi:branched-chain amino acid transport system ATP-binding protein